VRVLVLGPGGREHALVWGLTRSASVDEVLCAPGNPGIEALAECVPVSLADVDGVAALADARNVDLVLVGPEQPLVDGVVDAIAARGRLAFGPTADAARLEGSKQYMKEVLVSAGVPTARHAAFGQADEAASLAFLETLPGLYVVKTDGLAAGKGVVVTESIEEARDTVRAYLSGAAFGDAGRRLVIEEGMRGPELSLLVVCNGDPDAARPLAPAQDFKRIADGDAGPNTGGMGAYSPVPIADDAAVDHIMERAIGPTLRELAHRGIEYRGVLYAGLMFTPEGPKMVEYNVRFGDPETEVVVPRLTTDLGALCRAAAAGEKLPDITFTDDACITVVMASERYPAEPRTGDVIEGLDAAARVEGAIVFHAGTRRDGDVIRTAGGRVLAVTAMGATIEVARARAYDAADRISWPGRQYRRDIALGAAS
jgi:phosphoribosylamine--glycine ligase